LLYIDNYVSLLVEALPLIVDFGQGLFWIFCFKERPVAPIGNLEPLDDVLDFDLQNLY